MSNACAPILVRRASPVSEILLPSKTTNFPFLTMDYSMVYSPWSSKNLIDRNRLKKFMQVCIDVKCIHTNFGGCTFSGFGDTATFKNGQFPFLTMDCSPWSSKNLIDWNQLKKFMQVCFDVKCMRTNYGGWSLSGFGDTATFKNGQFSLSDHGLYSPWSSKNLINWNQLKKFMQVCIDVKCMHTNFSGRSLSGFGDTATFKNGQFSLSDHGL